MKFTTTQSVLNSYLSLVGHAVPSRPTHPILANIKIIASEEKQTVELTGFDLSLGIEATFKAEVAKGGELTLPAKLLTEIVAKMSGEVTIDARAGFEAFELRGIDNIETQLQAKSGKYKLSGMSTKEYPEIEIIAVDPEKSVSFPAEDFLKGLKALVSASEDETKMVLTGVNLRLDKDGAKFASTDSHRLSVISIPGEFEEFEVTIPKRTLEEVRKALLFSKAESLEVNFQRGLVSFTMGAIRINARILDGQFPQYPLLLPDTFTRQITCDRRELIAALERILVLVANELRPTVCLNFTESEALLFVSGKELGNGEEVVPIQLIGDPVENLAFNIKYALQGLKVFDSEQVLIQINEVLKPIVLSPVSGDKHLYLVVPVQLKAV